MKLKPLHDKLVVRPLEAEEVTRAGIVLPDTAKEKPQQGVVLSVGPGKMEEGKRLAMDVKAGDTILFSKYAGDDIKVDGEELKILGEGDVLAIIEK